MTPAEVFRQRYGVRVVTTHALPEGRMEFRSTDGQLLATIKNVGPDVGYVWEPSPANIEAGAEAYSRLNFFRPLAEQGPTVARLCRQVSRAVLLAGLGLGTAPEPSEVRRDGRDQVVGGSRRA